MNPKQLAQQYYDAFHQKADFNEVPLAEDLIFKGPGGEIKGAASFRAVVAGLAQQLVKLEIRDQLASDTVVVSVYDFDLGLPDGPIPMAEKLCIRGNEITEIELFFDSRRLPGGPA